METNVKIAFKQAEQEEQKSVATYLYKYSDFKSSVAINELMKLDLFKNKFSRPTLNNYTRALRRFLQTGERIKIAPPYIYDVAQKLVDKHYAKLTPSEENKFKERVESNKSKVTTPVTLQLTETSKQSVSSILNVRSKLELESANAQNSIKKLQDKLSEINGKLKAISVVMDLLK